VVALVVGLAGAADHDVGVVVDRVDRVADGHHVVQGEDVQDVGAVALGAVGDEHLLGLQADTQRLVGFLDDGVDQPVVALLRAVAGEMLGGAQVVHGVVEGLQHGRRQRAGHVADAQADDLGGRVGLGEGAHAAADLGEQVAGFKFQVVVVDLCHRWYVLLGKYGCFVIHQTTVRDYSSDSFSTLRASLFRYICWSACLMASGRSAASSTVAYPSERDMGMPSTSASYLSASDRTRFMASLACSVSTPGSSTANSSPPMRATTSSVRKLSSRISVVALSSSSPTGWPYLSLHTLRPSMSAITTETGELRPEEMRLISS